MSIRLFAETPRARRSVPHGAVKFDKAGTLRVEMETGGRAQDAAGNSLHKIRELGRAFLSPWR